MNGAHPAGRQPGSTYWLIAKNPSDRVEVLTIECGGERALPVFSFEEEAELFLGLGGIGDGWWVRESGAGEIVSVLYGPCAGVRSVALDPPPEMVAEEAVGLVSLSRKRFVEHLVDRGRQRTPGAHDGRNDDLAREAARKCVARSLKEGASLPTRGV